MQEETPFEQGETLSRTLNRGSEGVRGQGERKLGLIVTKQLTLGADWIDAVIQDKGPEEKIDCLLIHPLEAIVCSSLLEWKAEMLLA